MIPASIFRSPFFWFLAFLLLAELAAAVVNPYREIPAASEVARNPLPLRGWPEYLRAGKQSGETFNIAIIGNSQGVAKEIVSASEIYPAYLEQSLREKGYDINIENWSIHGLRTDQIELLSMIAAERQLDLLLIIVGIKSLDIVNTTRLGANADDLDLVAGWPRLWPQIRRSNLLGDIDWDDLLLRSVLVNTRIGRLRPYVLDRLAAIIPWRDHSLVFGHRRSTRALQPIGLRNGNKSESRKRQRSILQPRELPPLNTTTSTWEKQFLRNRLPTFQALFPGLHDRLHQSNTRLVWIWMPVYPGDNTLALRSGAAPAYATICKEIKTAGSDCIDLTHSLPAHDFVTLSASSHLNRVGHRSMSVQLLPVIEDALH